MARLPAFPCDSVAPSAANEVDVWRAGRPESQQVSHRNDVSPVSGPRPRLWLLETSIGGSARCLALVASGMEGPNRLDPDEHYQILAHSGRIAGITTSPAGAGAIQLRDLTQEDISLAAVDSEVTLCLPRALIDTQLPEAARLHGRTIRNEPACVLANLIRTIPAYLHHVSDDAAGALAATIRLLMLDTISLALAGHGRGLHTDRHLLEQITDHIRCRLTDQFLTPATICEEFAISRATLYRLFAPEGGVARFITRERLQAIHARLAAGTDDRPLADIAHEFGFGSHSSFARSFRHQFGYPPSKVRPVNGARSGKFATNEASLSDVSRARVEEMEHVEHGRTPPEHHSRHTFS